MEPNETKSPASRTELGIPGLRGTEHVAFTVPDLDEAVDFFTDVICCEVFYHIGPFKDPEGDWFSVNFGLHPAQRSREPPCCVVRLGQTSRSSSTRRLTKSKGCLR